MVLAMDKDSGASHFGGGIVEISAVATLLGGPVASSMTLGLRSACCLPWASMSCFGLLHVAKASLAASIPDQLRDALGLQDSLVEDALGLCVPLRKNEKARVGLTMATSRLSRCRSGHST